jgi:trans-aconitate methyltransferase
VLGAGLGASVGDIGCGTGRLEPYLAARGLSPRGIDLSPEMIRVARRDQPRFEYDIAERRRIRHRVPGRDSPEKQGASAQGYLLARKT